MPGANASSLGLLTAVAEDGRLDREVLGPKTSWRDGMDMEGRVYYKGDEVRFVLPKSWNLPAMAEPKEVPSVQNIRDEVKRALKNPIGMDPLAKLIAEGKRTVAIISEDQTRPSPSTREAKSTGFLQERLRCSRRRQ